MFTADCVALIVADPERPALGVAHAGWRGTVRGIAGRLVTALVERAGARPERLHAAIGPSIGPCCYEVDEPVVGPLRAAFPAAWDRWARPGAPDRPGHWWLDLWAANADQLVAAGVRADAIWNPRLCTALPAGPVLLVPEGGAGRAPRDARGARLGPSRSREQRGAGTANPLE